MQKPLIWQGNGWTVRLLYSAAGVATSLLVSLESGSLLLDSGDGTLRDLVTLEADLHKLAAVFLSHAHFDHVGGLHSLLGFMRMIGRSEPFRIFVPRESLADSLILAAFVKTYHGTIPFALERVEIRDGEEVTVGEVTVKAFGVVHCGSTRKGGIGEPLPAVGYTLTKDGQRVVYTGDCGLDSCLEEKIKGADLAVVEATLGQPNGEMERRVHLSLQNAGRLAGLARRGFIIHRTFGQAPLEVS